MIEIKTIGVFGFEGALRGMRNPYESHEKSDSGKCPENCARCVYGSEEPYDSEDENLKDESWYSCIEDNLNLPHSIGKNDMALCKKLIKGGSEHRKFLRMIHVQADVIAPRYWWQEFDTYKVGTVANSSSTMHLIGKRELTIDDFTANIYSRFDLEHTIIPIINKHIRNYKEGIIDKPTALHSIKQILPESFLQLRTVDFNYETAMTMYRQRKNHRLQEWCDFSRWIESLPYMKEFLEVLK